jgi:hypothetical protein
MGSPVNSQKIRAASFPLNQTLVIRAEDHAVDKIGVLNQIYHHLGLGIT